MPAAHVFMVTPFCVLTPGSHGRRTFEAGISDAEIIGVKNLSTLLGTILALAFATLLGTRIMHGRVASRRQQTRAAAAPQTAPAFPVAGEPAQGATIRHRGLR